MNNTDSPNKRISKLADVRHMKKDGLLLFSSVHAVPGSRKHNWFNNSLLFTRRDGNALMRL